MKAIYIRTSTEEQNPDNQIKDCETLTHGEEYKLYKDQQSAWKDTKERPDFERLKKDIAGRTIDLLIVWDLDRLYRNRLKLKEFLQYCKVYNCMILSFRQKFLNELLQIPKPFDDIMFNFLIDIFGWIAEDESKKKSDRIKISKRVIEGITYSYRGNKWGRKKTSIQKVNRIRYLLKSNPRPSMRVIAKEVNCSLGLVHKISRNFYDEKITKEDGSIISQ